MNSKQLAASWKRADMKKLRDELSERELRERCLQRAVDINAGRHPKVVVEAAEAFVAFVTRARPAKRQK